jgi:type III pantothenate kinase
VLLAIDAGNTQTVVGLYRGTDLIKPWRLATNADRSSDEHALLIRELLDLEDAAFEDVTGIAICSGVPAVTAALREMADRYFSVSPVVVEPGTRTGVPILYENPKEVGADRIANAVGAFDRYGGPVIVVDFGTATTVDATSAHGEYLGGAIMPGIEISLDALFARAAALTRIKLVEPKRVIGKSTVESVQSGTLHGFSAAVDGLCRRFQQELGPTAVVATGGLGELIAPYSECIEHYDPWLTLHGLRLIYSLNRGADA